jgi:hypothetical protein
MDKQQKERIQSLIERLMAGESREIYMAENPSKKINRNYNQTLKELNMSKIKRDIAKFIKDNNLRIHPEAVKTYAINHLKYLESIATLNSSFGILRQRIERGEYDFNFVVRQQ